MGYEENWRNLQYIEDQTEELCLEAVKQNLSAAQFIDKEILYTVFCSFTELSNEQYLGPLAPREGLLEEEYW